jgi:hypothetical protein
VRAPLGRVRCDSSASRRAPSRPNSVTYVRLPSRSSPPGLAERPRPSRSRRGCRRRSGRARPARSRSLGSSHCAGSLLSGQEQHALDAGADQPPGLELVQPAQAGRAPGAVPATSRYCPPTIPSTPGRGGQLAPRGQHVRRADRPAGRQQQPERLRVEPVAGEDRDVLAERAWQVGGRGAGRRRPSPAGRRGSASRCGSARARPPAAAPRTGRAPIARAVASASTGRIRLPPASSE